jgi:hypothetical protein
VLLGHCVGLRTSENANCRQFTILHRKGAHGVSEGVERVPGRGPVLAVVPDRPTLVVFATYACYRSHNGSPRRISLGHADGGRFLRAPAASGCGDALRDEVDGPLAFREQSVLRDVYLSVEERAIGPPGKRSC